MATANEWYRIDNISELDSPALVVYKERVEENIRQLKNMVKDVLQLRPHVKTHKSAEVAELLLEAGIQKFKCATIAEAEMLAGIEAPDVLLAYQPVGPKVQRFIQLMQYYPGTRFSCLIDNLSAAEALANAAVQQGISIPVYIDLNVGMNRTGISLPDAMSLYQHASRLKGIVIKGLHVYDGHIRQENIAERTKACNAIFEKVMELKNNVVQQGYEEPIIIAGGSPTFPIHAQREGVECSPGTFVYWDAGYGATCREQPFQPAALVISRIISLPDATKICTDLGHKSIASENELGKRVFFLNAPDVKPVSQSEEHLVLEAAVPHRYKVGEVLYGLPYHICPTCALYERAYVVEHGAVTGEWKMTARDRKITV